MEFCDWTKARINKGKTKLLGLGTWSLDSSSPGLVAQPVRAPSGNPGVHGSIPSKCNTLHTTRTWPYEWITQVPDLKILGITFSHNIPSTIKLNWHQQSLIIQNILIKNTSSLHLLWPCTFHQTTRIIATHPHCPCPPLQQNPSPPYQTKIQQIPFFQTERTPTPRSSNSPTKSRGVGSHPTLPIFPITLHPPNLQITHSSRGPRETCSCLLVGATPQKSPAKNHTTSHQPKQLITCIFHEVSSHHHQTTKVWNHHTNVICQSSRHLQSPDI